MLSPKVCNNNYGNTQWKGINLITLQYNYIIDSVVKINDFYFQTQNKQEMRYIICHKVGHRFGLGHTNKDFGNPNLGDCMDYTNHPKDNMGPDITDFEALANINRVV